MSDEERMRGSSSEKSVFTPGVLLRLQYACYLFFGLVVTMFLRGSLGGLFANVKFLRKGCEVAANSVGMDLCAGEVLVYRVSFSLAVFFFLHWLSVSDLTCCITSDARAEFQHRFFFVKSIILVLLFVATMWIPNSFFAVYAYVCLFASGIFLLMNVIFLVDFSYHWSEDWGQRSETNNKWMWYLIIVSVFCFAGGAAVSGVSYYFFVPYPDCTFNACAITIVLVAALVYTVLSIWVPHGSIVPSGIVLLYTSGMMFVTLRNTNNERCNKLALKDGETGSILQMIFTSLVSGFALGWSVVSSGGNSGALGIGKDEDDNDEDPNTVGHLSKYMFFYFTMMLGSMYLAMLASGWRVSGGGEATLLNSINIAMWVRSATVWSATLLYVWSLVAPYYCCNDRDFGYGIHNDW